MLCRRRVAKRVNPVDWAGLLMSSSRYTEAEWFSCGDISAAGAASGRIALTNCILAMSCQVSHLAIFSAASLNNWYSGKTAACVMLCGGVEEAYCADVGRIQLLSMGNVNKFSRVNWVIPENLFSDKLARVVGKGINPSWAKHRVLI